MKAGSILAFAATAMAIAGAAGAGGEPQPAAINPYARSSDGSPYTRGSHSSGVMGNKAFCSEMAARALPPLAHECSLRREWRKVKNAAKRARRLARAKR